MGFLGLAREPEGRPLQHPSSPRISARLGPDPGSEGDSTGASSPAVPGCWVGRSTCFRKGASAPERPQHGLRAGHLSSDAPDVSFNIWADPSGGKQAPGQTPLAPAGRLAKLHKLRGKRAPSEVLTLLTEVEGCRARPGQAAGVRRGRYQV